MADEQVAESSPAESEVTESPNPESQAPVVENVEGQDIFTEKTVEAEESKEEAAASESGAEKSAETESSSEDAGRSDGDKPESKAERRIKQLTAKVKAYEEQLTQAQRFPQPVPMIREPVKPDIEKFDGTVEQFRQAMDKYDKEVRQYAIEQDRVQREQERQKQEQQKREAQAVADWQKREQRILKSNPEFNVSEYLTIVRPNPTMDGFLVDSEVGPEILNYYYDNPDEAEKVRTMTPYKTMRALVKLEEKISNQVKGILPRKPGAKAVPKVSGSEAGPAREKSTADLLYG